MTDTVTITKHDLTSSATNTPITLTYVTVAIGVKARIEPLSGARAMTLMGRFPNASHRMFIRSSVDVKPGYRVLDDRGRTFEVESQNEYEGFSSHHREAILAEKAVS